MHFRERLIWIDPYSESIESVDKLNGEHRRIISRRQKGLSGLLAVDESLTRLAKLHHQACAKSHCSHLCILAENPVGSQDSAYCACPEGMVLSSIDRDECVPRIICSKNEYLCLQSNQCIDEELRCDGKFDCKGMR